MKKTFTFLLTALFGITMLFGQTSHKLDKVTENSVDYWDIDTPEDLIWLTDTLNLDADKDGTADFDSVAAKWAANYRLAADITFDPDSSKVDWNGDGTVNFAGSTDGDGWLSIADWNRVDGPIVRFSGTFNGQYHTISNIYSALKKNKMGVFGDMQGAKIENLKVMNFRGHPTYWYLSVLVGRANYAEDIGSRDTIRRVWVEGTFYGLPEIMDGGAIEPNLYVGGIAGRTGDMDIIECVSKITAHGETTVQRRISGLVGQMELTTKIKDSYSISMITAEEQSGIIIGRANGETTASIENCYSAGLVVGKEPRDEVGNFAGNTGGVAITSCYWDKEIYGDDVGVGEGTNAANVVGLMTADFATESNFVGWDFTSTWKMGLVDGVTRPYLQWQDLSGGSTSVKKLSNSGLIKAYPNPASLNLIIENAPLNAEYRLMNMIGQTVESGYISSSTMILDVESYEKGIYLLKVGDNVSKILIK